MSQWRGQFDADSPFGAAVDWLSNWYHVPTLLLMFVFVLWTRARTWGEFVVGGEVLFSGNDAFYHYREVKYVTENWPSTMPFDVWTNFPTGTSVSQFGTLFDQVVGTAALIVGLGSPTDQTVRMVLLFAPAVLGALTVIPTYYLGKLLGGRVSGIIAVVVLALSTGELMRRGMVGFADHHVAEALMQAFAVLAIVVAIKVADDEKPVWELVVDRDLIGLQTPLLYAALAGVATALYIWTWPPGALLLGVLGVYVTLQLWLTYIRGREPEPLAMTVAVIFGVAGVLLFLPVDTVGFSATTFSLLQPTLAIAGAAWCGLLAWIARFWNSENYSRWAYPLPSLGLLTAGVVVLALGLPDVFDLFVTNVQRVLVPGSTGGAATVAEVQSLPWDEVRSTFYARYGLAAVIAGVGAIVAVGFALFGQEERSELLFVSVWLAIMTLAAITQQRFGYYMTIPVATMTAYVVGLGVKYVGSISDGDGFETYQIMVVVTVLMLIVVPMATATTDRGNPAHVINQTDTRHNGPGGIVGWQDGLGWMANNTPSEGTFAGADNEMDPYATHPKTDDFDYPEGSYGVMSWWDYGHWITTSAERIPVANPFQQSANDAARFLLAQNETQAESVMAEMSDGENRETRYVMVDWQMVSGGSKFSAPPAFVEGVSRDTYVRSIIAPGEGGFFLYKQAYYETMVNRLYRYHGSARDPIPIVADWDVAQAENRDGEPVEINTLPRGANASVLDISHQNLADARQSINDTDSAQIGGFGGFPSERVEALDHYRLVHASERQANPLRATHPGLLRLFAGAGQELPNGLGPLASQQGLRFATEPNPQYTKTFERVPGATIEGEGPANSTIQVSVEMAMPNSNRTFDYRQRAQADADGSFTLTVPYATTGYDEYGPENGYTNTSVRAVSDYEFSTRTTSLADEQLDVSLYNATAGVSEAQVVGDDDSPVEVTLTEVEQPTDGNQTDGSGSDSSGSLVDPAAMEPAQLQPV